MLTSWYYPNNVVQYSENEKHVAWTDDGTGFSAVKTTNPVYIGTVKPLLHIANPTVNDLKMKTYFLFLTDFKINQLPEIITGVEVEIEISRGGRITDDTIQLRYQDEFIGENLANSNLDRIKTYGKNLWGVESIDSTILTDTSFGLGLRFQSHPSWPHREVPMINYVRLRII